MQFTFDASIKSISTKKGEDGPVSTIQIETELTPDEVSSLHELMSLSSFAVTMANEQTTMFRRQESKAPEVGYDALAASRR